MKFNKKEHLNNRKMKNHPPSLGIHTLSYTIEQDYILTMEKSTVSYNRIWVSFTYY